MFMKSLEDKKQKKSKGVKQKRSTRVKCDTSDNYGYDFVAELSHFTNIDEQRKNAKRLEEL